VGAADAGAIERGEPQTAGDGGNAGVVSVHRAVPGAKGSVRGRGCGGEQRAVQHRTAGAERQAGASLRPAGVAGLFFRPGDGSAARTAAERGAGQDGRNAGGGDQRPFLAEPDERRSGCNWADGEAERAERDDCGGDAEEVRWRAESQSIGAIRADHRAGNAGSGVGKRCAAPAQRKGFPAADAPCAGGHDRNGGSGAGWHYTAAGQGRSDGAFAGGARRSGWC
jgi:hypothetical protein